MLKPTSALAGYDRRRDEAQTLRLPPDHPPIRSGAIGVLLVNLGTPDGTGYWPMRRYLGEFLSDRRVIELPRILWQPILQAYVLATRPTRSGKLYAAIWNRELNESPLRTFTRTQAEKLAAELAGEGNVVVDWAMRYANPTTQSRLDALMAQGCDRILIVPLYPQYAAPTTATACDQAFRALMAMRWQPAVRVAPPWHDDPGYIEALAASMRRHLQTLDFEPERIVATFHGMPVKFLEAGDPYHCHCQKTSRLVREALGLPEERWLTTFQSRFGIDPWLQPYTDKTVERLAREGVKRIALVAPGFSADCLETLEELDVENRHIFESNGGEKFAYLPALNDSEEGIDVIEALVRRELRGWID